MNCNKQTLIRTIVLGLALVNQLLTAWGKNPLPFSEEGLYEGLSAAWTAASALWAWWKNNSFTKEAVAADRLLAALRKGEEE